MRSGFFLVAGISLLPALAQADCGCTGMTVNWRNAGGTYQICSNNGAYNFPECTRSPAQGTTCGGKTTYAWTCPIGPNSLVTETKKDSQSNDYEGPWQRTGFAIVATLAQNSMAEQCVTGQVLQERIISNGSKQPNPNINSTSVSDEYRFADLDVFVENDPDETFPDIDAQRGGDQLYGGDNYQLVNSATSLISTFGTTTMWWDNTDQTKTGSTKAEAQNERASWAYRFIAFVDGSDDTKPSCSCAFDINVDWTNTGAAAPRATVFTARPNANQGTVNCTFNAQ